MRALSILLSAMLAGTAAAQGETILWEKDLATATAKSGETGRPVLAYFTFDT